MIDGSEKRNRQLAFELQNSHVLRSAVINVFHRADMSCMANERRIFPSLFYPGPASFANVDDDFVIRKCL